MNLAWTRMLALTALSASMLAGCQNSSILRSTATLGQATLTSDSKPVTGVDFGSLDCGGEAPAAKAFTLTNDGDGPLRWSATIDSNTYFDLAGDRSGVLEAGQSATITVSAQKMPSTADAGEVQHATILFTTDDAARPQIYVPLKATAQGATLELVAPSVADFGQLPLGKPSMPLPITLKNTGNVPAKVSIDAPGDKQFTFDWMGGGAAVDVAPGASMTGLTASYTASNAHPSASAGLVHVEGAVCGQSAKVIPVKGEGLGGVVGVSPGMLDLGKVGCNTEPEAHYVTVYNAGNLVFSWKAALKDGSQFTLSQTGGPVIPGGSVQLLVKPKKFGMTTNLKDNGFGDTLTITTDIAGDTPHEVPIMMTAAGAILKWNATPFDFGQQAIGVASGPKPVAITNTGNLDVKVSVAGSGQFTGSEGIVKGGGGTFVSAVVYKPDNLGPQKGTMEVKTDDPVCQPLPDAVNATGSGKGTASAIALNGDMRNHGGAQVTSQSGCLILANSGGKVACFGSNEYGQLGTKTGTGGPFVVPGLTDIVSVTGGGDFNCAADKNGSVWCWGNNRSRNNQQVGKLGVTGIDMTEVPQLVASATNSIQVSAGHNMACSLGADGNVTCWGVNRRANLTNGIGNVKQISVGAGGGCAAKNDNTVWCWGRYSRFNIGNGNSDGQTGPVQVSNLGDAQAVSASTGYARGSARCALRMNGIVSCWGDSMHGQIGNGSNFRGGFSSPVDLPLSNVTQIARNTAGGCALMGDKTVQCWGRNHYGQVGDGTTFEHSTPSTVSGINDATALAAGGGGACAIVTGGSVKCWGSYGAGNNSTPATLKYF